jgi:hypothetical protein
MPTNTSSFTVQAQVMMSTVTSSPYNSRNRRRVNHRVVLNVERGPITISLMSPRNVAYQTLVPMQGHPADHVGAGGDEGGFMNRRANAAKFSMAMCRTLKGLC